MHLDFYFNKDHIVCNEISKSRSERLMRMMRSYLDEESFKKYVAVTLDGLSKDASSTITEFDKVRFNFFEIKDIIFY